MGKCPFDGQTLLAAKNYLFSIICRHDRPALRSAIAIADRLKSCSERPRLAQSQTATRETRTQRAILPSGGSPRDGGAAETLSAKRGTVRFAVTAAVFSVTYEPWSSRIFRSLTE